MQYNLIRNVRCDENENFNDATLKIKRVDNKLYAWMPVVAACESGDSWDWYEITDNMTHEPASGADEAMTVVCIKTDADEPATNLGAGHSVVWKLRNFKVNPLSE
jgi:hypothetical protein